MTFFLNARYRYATVQEQVIVLDNSISNYRGYIHQSSEEKVQYGIVIGTMMSYDRKKCNLSAYCIILCITVSLTWVDALTSSCPNTIRGRIWALNSSTTRNEDKALNFGSTYTPSNKDVGDPGFDTTLYSAATPDVVSVDEEEEDKGEKVANPDAKTTKLNLYEVLGASPTDTRQQIKRKFIVLAKQTHPDAAPGDDNSDRFSEIANAWKTLSNEKTRKRYDRTLKAERLVDEMEKLADAAVPAVNNVMEKVAFPFLRRTTATTVASWTAFSNKKNLKDAIRAGRMAADSMTAMEQVEKAKELQEQANQEMATAMALKEEWSELVSQRLEWSLQTENVQFTSLEAAQLLDGWNVKDGTTLFRRCTVAEEIEALQKAEEELAQYQQSCLDQGTELENTKSEFQIAEENAKKALDAEFRARQALEEAVRMVEKTQLELEAAQKRVKEVHTVTKKTNNDGGKFTQTLEKRRDRVKLALQQKQKTIMEQNPSATINAQEQKQKSLAELSAMRKQEKYLLAESTKMEDKARRLLSRAEKLIRMYEDSS